MPVIIITPRPPLSLTEVVRVTADDTTGGTLVYEVPYYRIPALGPTPERDVEAAAIITNVTISDLTSGTGGSEVSAWVTTLSGATGSDTFILASSVPVAKNSYATLAIEKQVLKSGDQFIVQMDGGNTADVHFSFILSTREEFTVLP
jgi:hypothetical protein